jgi:5-carboxymethyl-2-hydroxymuconate isomerase
MPHLTIEYTDNLPQFNANEALEALNKTLVASGQFEEIDIKSRAIRISTFLVGTSPDDRAFVHVKLAILSGRSIQIKHELSESLLLVLKAMCEWPAKTHVQLCVEVQEIERESYSKSFVG